MGERVWEPDGAYPEFLFSKLCHLPKTPPREQHCASRRANTPAHELRQLDTLLEKLVDVRCLNASAVSTDVTRAQVVGHDIDDVVLRNRARMCFMAEVFRWSEVALRVPSRCRDAC